MEGDSVGARQMDFVNIRLAGEVAGACFIIVKPCRSSEFVVGTSSPSRAM